VELNPESKLKSTRDLLEAFHLCGISIQGCKVHSCSMITIIEKCIFKFAAGKDIEMQHLIQEIISGCSTANGVECSYADSLKQRYNRSILAYSSPDGRKFWPNPVSERPENRYSRFEMHDESVEIPMLRAIEPNSIVTMGSCFMNEINKQLEQDGYLLSAKEENCETHHIFPAAWGTIFNPLSAKRALNYYFGNEERPEMLWISSHNGTPKYYDAFREDVIFNTLSEHQNNSVNHRELAKNVLKECKTFVAAFSMIETWLSSDITKYPLSRSPWRLSPLAATPYTLSYEEVVDAIEGVIQSIMSENSDCQVFIGVDPVPLHATHSEDSAVLADSKAKATLVAATLKAIEKSNSERVHYIPFFEIAHYYSRLPWGEDERHVSPTVIKKAYNKLIDCLISAGKNDP